MISRTKRLASSASSVTHHPSSTVARPRWLNFWKNWRLFDALISKKQSDLFHNVIFIFGITNKYPYFYSECKHSYNVYLLYIRLYHTYHMFMSCMGCAHISHIYMCSSANVRSHANTHTVKYVITALWIRIYKHAYHKGSKRYEIILNIRVTLPSNN